ncbi:MAG: 50S ribosomal protein L23 [Chlamydiae bacterium CG10_big_fil_rev_8_21_14_0_10_35_9]|nr:MAG: 50S ribosomal protein L23 [Chlamydiae bacterium CG10_big_fil_rev_8_21_14_0_10_35_9]
MRRNPYDIIKNRHMTEKSRVLENLQNADSNKSVRKYELPKYVFVVDTKANKNDIAWAIETIYAERKIKVKKVNTILIKPKARRVRGRFGKTKYIKKAVVTLDKGDSIEEQV